jgi:hypothetical protein
VTRVTRNLVALAALAAMLAIGSSSALADSPAPGASTGASGGAASPNVAASPDALSSSNCVNSAGNNLCDLFKSAGGFESDISEQVNLPHAVIPGYVVVKFSSGPANTNRDNWAAVVQFTANKVQMFAWGCNTPGTPKSCYPSYATITAGPNAFILLDPDGTTTYSATGNVYNFHLYKPISSGDKDHLSNLAGGPHGLHADSALYHEILHMIDALGPFDCAGVENLENFLIAHHDHFSVKGLNRELAAVDEVEVLSC